MNWRRNDKRPASNSHAAVERKESGTFGTAGACNARQGAAKTVTQQPLVEYELSEGVARITLNRPEALNSINAPIAEQLLSHIERATADPAVTVVLLAANGRAFCAGQDLAELNSPDGDAALPDLAAVLRERYNPLIRALRAMEKPVVCAVHGAAAGAGANLALACDIVIAADDAYFVESFAALGLVPDSGGTYFLPRLAGLQRAAAMCYLGEKVPARQALEWGLVYRVVPLEALAPESLSIAQKLAAMPASGLALIKRALAESATNSLEAQLELEAKLQGAAGREPGFRRALHAFMAKREHRGR